MISVMKNWYFSPDDQFSLFFPDDSHEISSLLLRPHGRSWSLLITYLAQLSLMGSRSKTTTSTWKCLLLIWSSALGSTLTGEQWTKKNGSGWAWGLAQSGLEHCEGTLFSNLIFEIKLQRQSEIFSNIIISTKCQYSSEVSQEGGVVIDDYAGVS